MTTQTLTRTEAEAMSTARLPYEIVRLGAHAYSIRDRVTGEPIGMEASTRDRARQVAERHYFGPKIAGERADAARRRRLDAAAVRKRAIKRP